MAMRDASWQFIGVDGRLDRQLSEEPTSSYGEDADIRDHGDEREYGRSAPQFYESPDDHEDILHPLRETANRVGREVERFAEVLDGYNPRRAVAQDERHNMAIDLINLYYNISHETLERLRERHYSSRKISEEEDVDVDGDDTDAPLEGLQTTIDDMQRWEQETQTWDLFRRLVGLRFPGPGQELERSKQEQRTVHPYASESELWDSFLESDDLALERRTVLQWLKDTADESAEDIDVLVQDLQQNADRGDFIAHGWLHTKHAIKNQKRLHTWPRPLDPASPDVPRVHRNADGTEPLVTQLDPDAPFRQKRKLEAKDEYFERAIWLGCYELLRRGKSSTEIREWCSERTEAWRAVSMSGFPDDNDADEDPADPVSSTLWRRMCFALARQGGGNEYQRAVYGILSGDISSVEPVCKTWDDFVFVHYNALLRSQFDQYLQSLQSRASGASSHSDLAVFDAIQFHGDPDTAGKRLIDILKTNPRIKSETLEPMKMLQGGLALSKFANANGLSSLIPYRNEQPENESITKYITLDDHDGLRVLTHILLVFMSLGVDLGGFAKETEVENVIVAYISFLRLAGKEELIPLYSSQLSGARKYAVLSRNLIDVTDHEQRSTQIKLMRELGLDVQEFVRMQSRYLLDDYHDDSPDYPATGNFKLFVEPGPSGVSRRRLKQNFLGEDDEIPERVDMLLIRSLEWYLLVDGLWSETFTVGTILYLRFYKHMHLLAARILASRVTSDQISRTKTRALLGESVGINSLLTEDEDLTEVLDGSSEQKRIMKRHLFDAAKSFKELEEFTEHLDNVETIAGHTYLVEEPDFDWNSGYKQDLAKTFPLIKSVAQCLFKGWLLTSQNEAAVAEFKQLRDAYLPEAILAYLEILQFGGMMLTRDFLLEAMELSTVIANEDSDLLELFIQTGRMEDLVKAFADASKTLLYLSSEQNRPAKTSRKMKAKGWKHELWNVVQTT